MTLTSPAELAAIQSIARSGMTGTATVLTRAVIETDNGQESVWAQVGEDVECWVYESTPGGATLGAIAGALGISEIFSIRVPIGTSVFSGDHLIVNAKTFNVEHTNSDSTYPAWFECSCRQVE